MMPIALPPSSPRMRGPTTCSEWSCIVVGMKAEGKARVPAYAGMTEKMTEMKA